MPSGAEENVDMHCGYQNHNAHQFNQQIEQRTLKELPIEQPKEAVYHKNNSMFPVEFYDRNRIATQVHVSSQVSGEKTKA